MKKAHFFLFLRILCFFILLFMKYCSYFLAFTVQAYMQSPRKKIKNLFLNQCMKISYSFHTFLLSPYSTLLCIHFSMLYCKILFFIAFIAAFSTNSFFRRLLSQAPYPSVFCHKFSQAI